MGVRRNFSGGSKVEILLRPILFGLLTMQRKLKIGSLKSEKIGSLESEKSGPYRSIPRT